MITTTPTKLRALALGLVVSLGIGHSAKATTSEIDAGIDAEIETYKQSIQTKGAGGLSLEASIGLGLTIAHCGPGFAVGVYQSIANSTDLETFKAEFNKTSPNKKCTISSVKLGTSLALLKERSQTAFSTFMSMAKNRLMEELKTQSN